MSNRKPSFADFMRSDGRTPGVPTLAQWSRKTGIPVTVLSRIRSGSAVPSHTETASLASAFTETEAVIWVKIQERIRERVRRMKT